MLQNAQVLLFLLKVAKRREKIEHNIELVLKGNIPHIAVDPAYLDSLGDSIALYPAQSLAADVRDTIVQYTTHLGRALGVRGLFNIQYVVVEGSVYVIEVNRKLPLDADLSSETTRGEAALERAERLALAVARPIHIFYRTFKAPISLLEKSATGVVHWMGLHLSSEETAAYTEEELRHLVGVRPFS